MSRYPEEWRRPVGVYRTWPPRETHWPNPWAWSCQACGNWCAAPTHAEAFHVAHAHALRCPRIATMKRLHRQACPLGKVQAGLELLVTGSRSYEAMS